MKLLGAPVVALACIIAPLSAARVDMIATSNDLAPGGGANLYSFGNVFLNNSGQVALWSLLDDGVIGPLEGGLFLYDETDGLTVIARHGDMAPGAGGGEFQYIDYGHLRAINDSGQTAFGTRVDLDGNGGVDADGLFLGDGSGGVSVVVRQGEPAPGVSGGQFTSFMKSFQFFPYLNNTGQVAFLGEIDSDNDNFPDETGLFRSDTQGGVVDIARVGDTAPGGYGGVFVQDFQGPFAISNMKDDGQTLFHGRIDIDSDGVVDEQAIFIGDSTGELSAVMRWGDAAPGIPGAVFSQAVNSLAYSSSRLNNSGQVAFTAQLDTDLDGASDIFGLFLTDSAGTTSAITLEGDTTPGAHGGSFATFWDADVRLSDAGYLLLKAGINTDGDRPPETTGLFMSDASGVFSEIVREGDATPGISGASFTDFSPSPNGVNNNGVILFRSRIAGSGVTSETDAGLWLFDMTGDSVLVVREGDSIADQVVRFVSNTSYELNDFGQVAYQVFFENNEEGVFLYTPDLHWRGTVGDGQWGTGSNWTLSLNPAHVHDVYLDADTPTMVTGPVNMTVRSLTIGGGAATTTLAAPASGVTNDWYVVEGVDLVDLGELTGTVAIHGDLTQTGGVLSPGHSPGVITVNGDYDQTAGALLIELDTGGAHDQLIVTGDVSLAGALELDLLSGYTPDAGDAFIILTANSIAGTFSIIEGLPIVADVMLGVLYDAASVTIEAVLSGDYNGDGFVGQDDLNILLTNWGQNVAAGVLLSGDGTGDGFVGQDDLNPILSNWGDGTPPSFAAVPEPGTAAMMLLALVAGRRRARKHGR